VVEQQRQRGHDDNPKRLDAHLTPGSDCEGYTCRSPQRWDVSHAGSVRPSRARRAGRRAGLAGKELPEREPVGLLPGSEPGRVGSPLSSEAVEVFVSPPALTLGGGSDCSPAPVGIAAAPGRVVRLTGHVGIVTPAGRNDQSPAGKSIPPPLDPPARGGEGAGGEATLAPQGEGDDCGQPSPSVGEGDGNGGEAVASRLPCGREPRRYSAALADRRSARVARPRKKGGRGAAKSRLRPAAPNPSAGESR
jgi:hypothetical protein